MWTDGRWLTYIAQNNETLREIAQRCGVPLERTEAGWSVRDIVEANRVRVERLARRGRDGKTHRRPFANLKAGGKHPTRMQARTVLMLPWHNLVSDLVGDDEEPLRCEVCDQPTTRSHRCHLCDWDCCDLCRRALTPRQLLSLIHI